VENCLGCGEISSQQNIRGCEEIGSHGTLVLMQANISSCQFDLVPNKFHKICREIGEISRVSWEMKKMEAVEKIP